MKLTLDALDLGTQILKLHLRGKHDQKTHGRSRGGASTTLSRVHESIASLDDKEWTSGERVGRNGKVKPHQQFSSTIYKRVEKGEESIVNNSYETLLLYDQNGKLLKTIKGDDSTVSIPFSQFKHFKNNILTHNHPVDFSLSGADTDTAILLNVREIRAVSKDHTFRMVRPEGGWPNRFATAYKFDQYTGEGVDMYVNGWWNRRKTRFKLNTDPDSLINSDKHELVRKITHYRMAKTAEYFQLPYYIEKRKKSSIPHYEKYAASERGFSAWSADRKQLILDKDMRDFIKRIETAMREKLKSLSDN